MMILIISTKMANIFDHDDNYCENDDDDTNDDHIYILWLYHDLPSELYVFQSG